MEQTELRRVVLVHCDRSHALRRLFVCAGGLQNHARIHKGERPFKCEWDGCDKAFAQKVSGNAETRTGGHLALI